MSMPHLPKISFPTAPTDPEELHDVVNVRDLEVVARRRLPNELYDYVRSGTGDEQTLRENEAAYQRVFLVPRILKGDLSSIDTRLTHPLVGSASLPVFVSPVGVHRLMHPDGELATMRACSRVGTLMGVSQHSTTALEEVAAAGPETPRWYQLYLLKDKQLTRSLVERAESAGYRAIVLCCDSVRFGFREADHRNKFSGLPANLTLANYPTREGYDDRKKAAWDQNTEELFNEGASWDDFAQLRKWTSLPILVKGVLSPLDAVEAVKAGCDGIVVSNHGGRGLDGALSALESLEPICEVVRMMHADIPIFLDGGVRRGTDVIKALALGATAVLVGKPLMFSLAAAGEEGVVKLFSILQAELCAAMAICGVKSLREIERSMVIYRGSIDAPATFLKSAL